MLQQPSQWPKECRNLIANQWQDSERGLSVESPYLAAEVSRVSLAGPDQIDAAINAAADAFDDWRQTPLKDRCQLLFDLRTALRTHIQELAQLAAFESGKTLPEAAAGINKGIEVLEFALSLQNLDLGGAMEVSRGVTCSLRREPLGVVAGIVPFNFPAMVPMWMFPIALASGNCMIMKPSEKVPLTMTRLAELMVEVGFPAGVFSLVQGDRSTAEHLIDHAGIRAVAFVGSTPAANAVYRRASANGKRCLALGGAKNHLIVVPDADPKITIKGVVDSFTGCAGQRCMAASLMVAVGSVDGLIDGVVTQAKSIELGRDMGAIIDKTAFDRIHEAIAKAESDGAKIILDGRKSPPPSEFPKGYWIGPTIIDHAEPSMACASDEIFGPVITIVRRPTLNAALELDKASPYGNATSVFTTSGEVARQVSDRSTSGMVGINIGVPVPREPFSFGGTKDSKFGHGDITGMPGVEFWTERKKITSKWTIASDSNWMS